VGVGGFVCQEPGGVFGVIPAGGGALGNLLPGGGQRLAHLGRHHRRDLVLLVVQDPGRSLHPSGSFVKAGQAVAGVGSRGCGQAALDVFLAHLVIGLHGLPGRRVDGRDRHDLLLPPHGNIAAAAHCGLARIALAHT
jgi:hypothetical protein